MKKTTRTGVAVLLLLTGLCLILFPLLERYAGERRSKRLVEEFYECVEGAGDDKPAPEEAGDPKAVQPDEAGEGSPDTNEGEERKPVFENGVIGIIEIESIGIKYPVMEGTDGEVLSVAIGHEDGTAGIGEAGNCVLCGHNGSRSGTFFTHLCRVKAGDVVRVTNAFGDVTEYEVTGKRIVEARESSIKNSDGSERLTLYTCAEKGTKRLVCDCMPKRD